MRTTKKILSLAIGLLLSQQAFATNGYFSHGYGVKSESMGGVGIALPQDALATAANPAGIALIGDRVDFGLTWFRPEREAKISGTAGGFSDGTFKGNARDNFFIPEGGFSKQINSNVHVGVSIYGNGGMNTAYETGIPLLNGGTGKRPGINYEQLFVAPTVAWQITPSQSIGASLILGYQRFKANGIDGFAGISASPNHLTGQGYDHAYGIGLHLGWIGQITDTVSLGASYQTKTHFEKFDKYKGLFAGGGNMDAPETYGVGIAVKATPQLTVAADVQRYLFSDVDAIGNSAALWNGAFFPGNLGLSNGPGFGWKDATAYKLGASYIVNETLTVRAGYDHVNQPIPSSETLFNILAPGVVQDHLTLGGTYKLPNNAELSVGYTHAFNHTVHGANTIPTAFGGGNVDVKMHQDALGIAYGWQL